MIEIKTNTKKSYFNCPKCNINSKHVRYIFQGIHNSEEFECSKCNQKFIWDLPIGHSLDYGFKYNLTTGEVSTRRLGAKSWFIDPYKDALNNPNSNNISIKVIKRRKVKKPLIINCLDYLYGHGLLKLFNIERHLLKHNKFDLILIIPKSLLWLVPKGVAEILVVNINLSQSREYFTSIDEQINKYISKFDVFYLSKAYAHPPVNDISMYTAQKSYSTIKNPRISFIWRSDRPWLNNIYLVFLFKKINLISILNYLQYLKVNILFCLLYTKNKKFKYTVVGFGKDFSFPKWIEDKRTNNFSKKTEENLCKVYAESKIVIGVHGSNMLLPSAHSDMVLDLMPDDRLGNFSQDIIYETKRLSDFRLRAFKFRYAYLNTSIFTLVKIISSMLNYSAEAERIYTITES
jgi:transcription elongation factor Elf1